MAPRYSPAAIIVEKIKNNVKKLGELFEFTHTYIALFLADNVSCLNLMLEKLLQIKLLDEENSCVSCLRNGILTLLKLNQP